MSAARYALKSLIQLHIQLGQEIVAFNPQLARHTATFAPALMESFGIEPESSIALLVTASSSPERPNSEAAFAALCGVSPIPASLGKTNRHCINRGDDRQANAALYRVVIVMIRYHDQTRKYIQQRIKEGTTKTEAIRCLRRYVAREMFRIHHDIGKQHTA